MLNDNICVKQLAHYLVFGHGYLLLLFPILFSIYTSLSNISIQSKYI